MLVFSLSPGNVEFENVHIFNPCFNIRRDKAKIVNSMICTFTLRVLHIVWQMKQFKVKNDKFLKINLLNLLQKILILSNSELYRCR